MARGQQRGGKSGGGTRTTSTNNRTEEDSTSKQNANNTSKGGQRTGQQIRGAKDKMRNNADFESHKSPVEEAPAPVATSETVSKPHHLKSAPQPTSEQLMIAQLIGGDTRVDDPQQRQTIQKIMEFTGMEEDIVATALFDARWDENAALNFLLEESDNLFDWQETGSKKRKNKQKQASDEVSKDEWDDGENQDHREKSRTRGGGPPRMRRGGSQANSGPRNRDQSNNDRPDEGGEWTSRRGTGAPRRGESSRGRGGAGPGRGGRAFQNSRQPRSDSGNVNSTSAGNNTVESGNFAGSIDTWNNPASTTTSSQGGASGSAGPPGRRRGHSGKDAFDNAGNWGDDFPTTDDWDNEEYQGSLADTKVFTARTPASGQTSAAAVVAGKVPRPQTAAEVVGSSSVSRQPEPNNPAVIGPNRSFASSVNGPSTGVQQQPAAATSSYQTMGLSTLLTKPTTQSSLANASASSQQQATLLFNQQATDSLRAGLGLGQPPSGPSAPSKPAGYGSYGPAGSSNFPAPPNTNNSQTASYAQSANSAFTSIKPTGGAPTTNGQPRAPQQPNKVAGPPGSVMPPSAATAPGQQPRSRLPPTSKIPSSAVEMPGDNVGHLDVQFGGLDLKFGSSSESSVMGGFEFGSVDDSPASKYLNDKSGPVKAPAGLYPPSGNKDVKMPPAPSAKLQDNYSAPKPQQQQQQPVNNASAFSSGMKSSQPPQQQQPQQSQQSSHQQQQHQHQQQHQNDSLGSYYSNYGQQQQSKSYQQQQQQSYQQQPFGNYGNNSYQNNSSGGYGGQSSYASSSTQSSGYKMPSAGNAGSTNQYQQQQQDPLNKFDSLASGVASTLGHQTVLGLTTTTNALSGKVSATTAGKMPNVPNLPPGVASMLPQHYMTSLPPAAFYSLQQPTAAAALYSAYGSGGMEDLAALQRSAGLHQLVGASNTPTVPQPGGMKAPSTGYYDPTSQYGAGGNRGDSTGNSLGTSNNSNVASTASSGANTNSNSTEKSAFGSVVSSTDSNSSPIPSTGLQAQSSQQSQQQQQAAAFNLAASSAFAAQQHMPPGYAYFYGGVPGLQAYGAATATRGVYAGAPMTVPQGGASNTNQFQKNYSYGSAYDTTLGQQGSKDFASGYAAGNGAGMTAKSATGGNQAPATAGHQYWGTSPLASGQLW